MPKVDAVLFDLDDTLLGNNMDSFLLAYFPMMAEYVRPIMEGDRYLSELMIGTQAMIADTDPDRTNREVFWSEFCQRTGLEQEMTETFIAGFYTYRFKELMKETTRRPVAREILQLCFDQHLHVVVATNPLFPISAIEQRMEWGGVSVTDFNYSLITSYENMHFTKPHVAYYREILERLGLTPERTLMVGDDWENDIVPAAQLGIKTFWLAENEGDRPGVPPDDQGSIDELYEKLSAGWLIS